MSPIYVYTCVNEKCPHYAKSIEELRKMEDIDKEIHCQLCNTAMKREVTGATAHYKTLGFHTTDYTRGGKDPKK